MKVEATGHLSYPGGYPIFLSRFVVFGDEPRHVALRFVNASEIVMTGIRFVLIEKDEKGQELRRQTLEHRGLFVERGTEFPVPDATVSVRCMSVEAEVEAAFSDEYEYVVEGDSVELRFGESTQAEPEPVFLCEAKYKVRRSRGRSVFVTLFAVLALVASAFFLGWRLHLDEKVIDHGKNTSNSPGEGEVRITAEYVEA